MVVVASVSSFFDAVGDFFASLADVGFGSLALASLLAESGDAQRQRDTTT